MVWSCACLAVRLREDLDAVYGIRIGHARSLISRRDMVGLAGVLARFAVSAFRFMFPEMEFLFTVHAWAGSSSDTDALAVGCFFA